MNKIELAYIVYLDWNVIADLEANKLTVLEEKLFKAKERKAISIPFSSTHTTEACNIASKENINSRLSYISKLSSNLYFAHELITTEHRIETPISVHNIISESDIGIDIDKLFGNIISFYLLRDIRKLLKLDPAKLNNISPEDAIDEINKIITSEEIKNKYYQNYKGDVSFMGIINTVFNLVEQEAAIPVLGYNYYQNKYNKLEAAIVMIFSALDSFGFWSDDKITYERGSRYADAIHAFNGVFANLVISADRKFCMKSRATYSLLEITTKVLNLGLDEDEIIELLETI